MCKCRPNYSIKSNAAISLMEMMVTMAILSFAMTVMFNMLNGAQSNFFNSDASIDLRNSLRLASEKITLELRNTGYKAGVAQYTLLNNTGVGGSDIVRFSYPIICTTTGILLDASGNPANWGAALTWGCNTSSCMDANNSCAVLEYKYVQYALNNSNQLIRTVLDANLITVSGSTSIVGQYITDFQIALSGQAITFTITGQKTSATRRVINSSYTNTILINNQGG